MLKIIIAFENGRRVNIMYILHNNDNVIISEHIIR